MYFYHTVITLIKATTISFGAADSTAIDQNPFPQPEVELYIPAQWIRSGHIVALANKTWAEERLATYWQKL